MKYDKLIFLILLTLQSAIVFCQTVEFTYDENGNRTSRKLTIEELKSGNVEFPVGNFKNLHEVEEIKTNAAETFEVKIILYPNPNKGLLKIDISNMPSQAKNELRLYDLSGVQLLIKHNLESYSELDISQLKNGIYILSIKINENLFNWKVVKNNY